MPRKFAENTTVSEESSRAEIERIVMAFGASQFATFRDDAANECQIAFAIRGLRVRFSVPLPRPDDPDIVATETGRERSERDQRAFLERERRRRWRALVLCIKAKIESIATGITTVEQEFLAHVIMPDGRTIGEATIPQLQEISASGKGLPLLTHKGSR